MASARAAIFFAIALLRERIARKRASTKKRLVRRASTLAAVLRIVVTTGVM